MYKPVRHYLQGLRGYAFQAIMLYEPRLSPDLRDSTVIVGSSFADLSRVCCCSRLPFVLLLAGAGAGA